MPKREPEEDAVKEALEAFEEAEAHETDNRVAAKEDIDFVRLGNQWPKEIMNKRRLEGRPCLTINKLPALGRQVINDARQNKPAITFHPSDSNSDPETAQVLDGLVRSIEYASHADAAYDTALEGAVYGGVGYFKIGLEYACDDTFEQDIRIQRIANPFTIYGDPNSEAVDSSDWNVAFEVEKMTCDEFERRFPDAEKVDWKSDFKGKAAGWIDGENVQVAVYWTREEVVRQIVALDMEPLGPETPREVLQMFIRADQLVLDLDVYTKNKDLFDAIGARIIGSPRPVRSHKVRSRLMSGAEVLEETPWAGKYIPIIPVYGDEVIDADGKRHLRSMFRDTLDAQRMYNYWRTNATEMAALAPKAPWIAPKGTFDVDPNWATANTETHAFLEYDASKSAGSPPQRQFPQGPDAASLALALSSSDDVKDITGIHDASLGIKSNETSGRAIAMRQKEGDVSTFNFIDNLTRGIRHAGVVLADLIPHVYGAPRILRILGPDKTPYNVSVNGAPPQQPPQQQQGLEQAPQQAQNVAQDLIDLTRVYDLRLGKYDVIVEAGPSYSTRRMEAADQMMTFVQAFPAAAPVMGDLVAKNLDWPGAKEIAERLQKLLPAPLQGPSPEMQQLMEQAQQLQQEVQQAQQALAQAQTDKQIEAAKLALEAKKIEIEAFKAQTDRMEALAKAPAAYSNYGGFA